MIFTFRFDTQQSFGLSDQACFCSRNILWTACSSAVHAGLGSVSLGNAAFICQAARQILSGEQQHAICSSCILSGLRLRPDRQMLLAAADANILINTARLAAQRHLLTYQEPIPVEQLVRALCDNKQAITWFLLGMTDQCTTGPIPRIATV